MGYHKRTCNRYWIVFAACVGCGITVHLPAHQQLSSAGAAILALTTLALIPAQVRPLQQVKGGKIIGFLFVLLFLAVVGAYCDVEALIKSKEVALVLMTWVTVIVFVHGMLIFTIGGLLKQDWDIISIASNANIGGATSAAVLATSLNRSDLRLPGILVGSVGNAIGTYLGVPVAEYLK